MANTYYLIASTTVGSGGSTWIDFTSIPQTYTDLKLVFSGRFDNTNNYVSIKINGDTGLYSYVSKELDGNGSSASSGGWGTAPYWAFGNKSSYTANTFGNTEIYFSNYTGSQQKNASVSSVTENQASALNLMLSAGLWQSTAAITSISIRPDAPSNWVQYSTAYLYGIKNS